MVYHPSMRFCSIRSKATYNGDILTTNDDFNYYEKLKDEKHDISFCKWNEFKVLGNDTQCK